MNRKSIFKKPYGLRRRFIYSIVASLLLCAIVFCLLSFASNYLLSLYFNHPDFRRSHVLRLGESLQSYIDRYHISSKNLETLEKWETSNPIILLEFYANDQCIYTSFYDSPFDGHAYDTEIDDRYNVISVQLADIKANAVLYCDYSYKLYMISNILSLVISFALFIVCFLRSTRKIIQYICRLNEEVQIIEGGALEYPVSVEGNDEISDLAKSMNRMRESFQQQLRAEQSLYHSNSQLVTEMSHDLRTPLTSILLYLEILQSHRYHTEEEAQKYLAKIVNKAHYMKSLTDRLFEYSLKEVHEYSTVSDIAEKTGFIESSAKKPDIQPDDLPETGSGFPEKPVKMESAFHRAIQSLKDELESLGFSVTVRLSWSPCFVYVYKESLNRISENIVSNIMKYADPSVTVQISTIENKTHCGFIVMNSYKDSGNPIESSGIGIKSIQRILMESNGICRIEQDDKIFKIILLFLKE